MHGLWFSPQTKFDSMKKSMDSMEMEVMETRLLRASELNGEMDDDDTGQRHTHTFVLLSLWGPKHLFPFKTWFSITLNITLNLTLTLILTLNLTSP
jgi:hypothetical protein